MIYTEAELPIEAYLASARLSHSPLKVFAELGPNGFYRSRVQREWSPEDTKHYVMGRACEDALQRPEQYAQRYIAKPKGMSFATKEGKAWKAEQEAAGLEIVDSTEARAIEALKETLQANEMARELIAAASMQMTIAHDNDGEGAHYMPGIQSRPDWLGLRGCAASDFYPYVLDLKTAKSLGDLASGTAVRNNGYHRQAAMVRKCLALEGVDVRNLRYFLLGAEKSFPYRWQVFELTPRLIDEGERWCDEQLRALAKHFASGEWPLITQQLVTVDVQRWGAQDDSEDEDDSSEEAA